jgi:hypothetical protein
MDMLNCFRYIGCCSGGQRLELHIANQFLQTSVLSLGTEIAGAEGPVSRL